VTVFNRRNAILGFLAWEGAKLVAKKKARSAVPSIDRETYRPNATAVALLVAVVAGAAAFFLRSYFGEDEALTD
jgi:hypothetical protein